MDRALVELAGPLLVRPLDAALPLRPAPAPGPGRAVASRDARGPAVYLGDARRAAAGQAPVRAVVGVGRAQFAATATRNRAMPRSVKFSA